MVLRKQAQHAKYSIPSSHFKGLQLLLFPYQVDLIISHLKTRKKNKLGSFPLKRVNEPFDIYQMRQGAFVLRFYRAPLDIIPLKI